MKPTILSPTAATLLVLAAIPVAAVPNTYPGADEPPITATGQMDWARY